MPVRVGAPDDEGGHEPEHGQDAPLFAILFTGRYPRSLFGYVEGVLRWTNRVSPYAFLPVADKYPPFRISA